MKLSRCLFLAAMVLLLAPTSLRAQHVNAGVQASAYTAERQLIESTLETVVAVIQEVTLQNEGSGLGERLRQITAHLTHATTMMQPPPAAVTDDDLKELRRLLRDVADRLDALRDDLEAEAEHELADRLAPIARDLRQAVREVERLAEAEDEAERVRPEDGDRWLRPGRYDDHADRHDDEDEWDWHDRDREARERAREREREARSKDRRHRHDDDRKDRRGWRGYAGSFVGEYDYRWPYRRETALYHAVPAARYNRVEGLMLGLGRPPLAWDDYGRGRIYGQLGYAFALDAWRYEVGAEVRLDRSRNDDFGLKVGGAYRRNTDTRDGWKTSWLENSLAAFFFENDFFDYYEAEGWTVYAVQRLTPYAQLSAGYRQEEYRTLTKETGWSLFAGDGFPDNPPIDEDRMQSILFAFEGGRVESLSDLPRGAAFRLEAEFGDGLGGGFAFNRYVADGRLYLPLSYASSLGLRLRGGLATGDFVPLQKIFTLGGIGSVRAYPQNAFPGTRMLLGNAEYVLGDVALLDDLFDGFQLLGFFDAGWVNTFGTDTFRLDDVLPAAGLGLGFDNRAVRLELAWPLRDLGDGRDPTLWLRISPSF